MEDHHFQLETYGLLPDASDGAVFPVTMEPRAPLTTYEGSLLTATASPRQDWGHSSSRSGSSVPSSSSQRPHRRIACITRSTEENEDNSPNARESPERFLDGVSTDASRAASMISSGGPPLSLHGLSLSSGHSKKEDIHLGSEILSRAQPGTSPVLSTLTSVTFVSTTLEGFGPEGPAPAHLSKSAKKRWKKKHKKQHSVSQSVGSPLSTQGTEISTQFSSGALDIRTHRWKDVVKDLLMIHVPNVSVRFEEQGIQNLGSTCFLGSAMQFLLASSQFCWLMRVMSSVHHVLDKAVYPVIYAMGSLGTSLRLYTTDMRREMARSSERSRLRAISPDMLSPIVFRFQSKINETGGRGEQDVQEFLQYLLDQMDQEILHIQHECQQQNTTESLIDREGNDDNWMFVGRKNKVSYQRTTGAREASILSNIFGGYVQSEVRASGMVSSITTHCFITLILDIAPDHVHSIEDALDLYTTRDTIPDYTLPGKNKKKVMATKSILLKSLPPYLIICLKQYIYTPFGLEKLHKYIQFGTEIEFRRNWMADGRKPQGYRLCATCNHHGQGRGGRCPCINDVTGDVCIGDHYTSNVLQSNGCWIHFDDSTFRVVPLMHVLAETPYLLMYERL